jgi:hypothetical protein
VTIHGNPFIEFDAFPDGFEPTFVEWLQGAKAYLSD